MHWFKKVGIMSEMGKEDLNWKEKKTSPVENNPLVPIIQNFILLLEEEKKKTLKQIEDLKKAIERTEKVK